ncbi:MAG: SHOCT domain-containing protein [Cyanobacteria bacterium J06635_1]
MVEQKAVEQKAVEQKAVEQRAVEQNRNVAIVLAFVGALQPTPVPLTFLHKLYFGQYGWSVVYFLLGFTQIARIACAIEGLWYLWEGIGGPAFPRVQPCQPRESLEQVPQQVGAIATALRELDQLRQEGLLSEYEFEQKRRQFLDQLGNG